MTRIVSSFEHETVAFATSELQREFERQARDRADREVFTSDAIHVAVSSDADGLPDEAAVYLKKEGFPPANGRAIVRSGNHGLLSNRPGPDPFIGMVDKNAPR